MAEEFVENGAAGQLSQSGVKLTMQGEDSPAGSNRKQQSGKTRAMSTISKIDPYNCSSEFMRKLTPKQQIASAERLTKGKPSFPAAKAPQGARIMSRALSTARPPDKLVKPKNQHQEERRQSGRHFNAMASVKYKTVTGKFISADRIENTARRLSTVGGTS
jgi:hypothetical protein